MRGAGGLDWDYSSCCGQNYVPHRTDVEVLTSGTCEGGLTWKWNLWRCGQVKMRPYWLKLGPNPVFSILVRRGKFGQRHKGRTRVTTEADVGVMLP